MRDPKPFRFFPFLWSVLALGFVLTIFASFRPFPASPMEREALANLGSIVSEGRFYTDSEPLAYLALAGWSKISFLSNDLSVISLSSLFFSLFLHMFLLLLRKEEWKRNHYILPFLAAFLPYSMQFPVAFFSETLCVIFVLGIFLTFRMERITDLLVFPSLSLLALLSHTSIFLLSFSFFVLIVGLRKARKESSKTSVFFKKRNIPLFLVLGYFLFLALLLTLVHYFSVFGNDSLQVLWQDWFLFVKIVALPLFLLTLGHFLLKTEKELNTITATGISVVLIVLSMFYSYREQKSTSPSWEGESQSLLRLVKQKEIIHPIRLGKDLSCAFYNASGVRTEWLLSASETPLDYYFVAGWDQADMQPLLKTFGAKKGKLPGVFSLGDKGSLVQKNLLQRVLENPTNLEPLPELVRASLSTYQKPSLFTQYKKLLQSLLFKAFS